MRFQGDNSGDSVVNPKADSWPNGFTLIELLIVVAIIAILAGLLLSALTQAKLSAYSVKCRSNLRQLALALQFYVEDFRAYPLFTNECDPRLSR